MDIIWFNSSIHMHVIQMRSMIYIYIYIIYTAYLVHIWTYKAPSTLYMSLLSFCLLPLWFSARWLWTLLSQDVISENPLEQFPRTVIRATIQLLFPEMIEGYAGCNLMALISGLYIYIYINICCTPTNLTNITRFRLLARLIGVQF